MLALICLLVALSAGWQGALLLRRAGPAQRVYALLLIGDAIVAGIAAASDHDEPGALSEVLGAVSIFAFFGLAVLPPILRDLARRALARNRIGLARGLTVVREYLSPGLGARQELEIIDIAAAVRAGRVEEALEALRARRAQAREPMLRQALDTRIILTLLEAGRWRPAIELFEQIQAGGAPATVPLVVEIVRAYGEAGDLEHAGGLLARLEASPAAREPALAQLLWRARMLFLAFAGRPPAVAALLAGAGPLATLPASSRAFWLGTARLFAGDRSGARAALDDAVRGKSGRDRQVIVERLAQIDDAALDVPRRLSPAVAELADRLTEIGASPAARQRVPQLDGLPWRATPATAILLAANVIAFTAVTLLLGSSEEPWVLVRAGANFKIAVLSGEWWRLYASTFLHVGGLHVAVNMLALWRLGRLVEQIFGAWRFAAIYFLSGMGGAVASLLFGGAGISAGASGAVFGVLGATIAELLLARRRAGAANEAEARWRRSLLQNLLFIAALNLAVGALAKMIDQSAHLGGLVVGAGAALLFAPGTRVGGARVVGLLARGLTILSIAGALVCAVEVARTSYVDTLARIGWERQTLGGVSLELPRAWIHVNSEAAADPTWMLTPSLMVDVVPVAEAAALRLNTEHQRRSDNHFTEIVPGPSSFAVPAGAGWTATELRFTYTEDSDAWRFRETTFEHARGDEVVVLSIIVPDERVVESAPIVARLLGSVELR